MLRALANLWLGARPREAVATIIRRETPALLETTNPLEIARLALPWVAGTCVWGLGLGQFHSLTADQIYREYWKPRREGATCGGMALFFKKVLHDLGVTEAFAINVGPAAPVTHVTVVVPYQGELYVFDPLTGTYFVNEAGCLASIPDMLTRPTRAIQTDYRRDAVAPVSGWVRDWRRRGIDGTQGRGRKHQYTREMMLVNFGTYFERVGFDPSKDLMPQFLRAGVLSHDGGEIGDALAEQIARLSEKEVATA